jgi:hypothetical protein
MLNFAQIGKGFEWERHGGGNRHVPRVVPIAKGKCLAVVPDDNTLTVMDEEGWARVAVAFRRNGDGELAEMALRKSANGVGVNIRHYDQQRTNIHVTVARHGKPVAKPDAGPCSVRRIGDVFVFDILSQVSIVAYGAGIDDDNDDGDAGDTGIGDDDNDDDNDDGDAGVGDDDNDDGDAGDDYTGAGDDDGSKD